MFSIQTASTALLSMLAATLLVAPASATTMEELSFEEMAYVADLVVEAVTIDNRVERIPGADHLRTVTRLELHHVIKGEAIEGDEVDVLVLGGRLDREETRLESAPIFTPDERVIVFLEQRKGDWRVVGLSQGKLTLVEEPSTARDVLVRVQPPRGLPRFEEALVQLPAYREYADRLTHELSTQVRDGHVPPYRYIPGIPAEKDLRFRSEAAADGQFIDPRWAELDAVRWQNEQHSGPKGGDR